MSSEINDSDIQLLLILLNQDGWDWYHNVCTALVAERDALRKERDEARRLYCEEWAFTIELERGEAGNPLDLAAEKGWDCYHNYLQDLG